MRRTKIKNAAELKRLMLKEAEKAILQQYKVKNLSENTLEYYKGGFSRLSFICPESFWGILKVHFQIMTQIIELLFSAEPFVCYTISAYNAERCKQAILRM